MNDISFGGSLPLWIYLIWGLSTFGIIAGLILVYKKKRKPSEN